ncbi:MAG: 2-hydroxyacid dehydrogenase, partial [Acetobacteraceae bacterium]|nr:2-hydroxyacid dehydrogenase [Acetobacteraceae bacterium]
MGRLPNLALIANLGTGLDKIDLQEARRRGVSVTHTADEVTGDVADLAIGMIVAVFRRTRQAEAYLRDSRWAGGPFPLARSLCGAKLGILGLGRIGHAVALRAEACGMQTAYTGRTQKTGEARRYFADAVALAAWADVLVVATAGGAETRALVDASVLRALGPEGLLVNVARGSVVDEAALADALASGALGAAALDVFQDEPRAHPGLLTAPNVLLLPHIGTSTAETRDAMARHVYGNVLAYLSGEPLTDAAV